jgi:hypothetical protein
MTKNKSEKPQLTKEGRNVVKKASPEYSVHPAQIKCIMVGIGLILLMNLTLSFAGLVLGLQMKSRIEVIQQDLAPIMEMADSLEAIGLGGDNAGGGFTPPLPFPLVNVANNKYLNSEFTVHDVLWFND